MSEIIPYSGRLAKRDSRAVRAELSRLDARGQVELARINQQADLQAERVAAVGYVGKRAMHEVAMLSQLEASENRYIAVSVSATHNQRNGLAAVGIAAARMKSSRR